MVDKGAIDILDGCVIAAQYVLPVTSAGVRDE
jgi:hypothetical protein